MAKSSVLSQLNYFFLSINLPNLNYTVSNFLLLLLSPFIFKQKNLGKWYKAARAKCIYENFFSLDV